MARRATEVLPALRQARFAAAAGFFTQGLVFISLTTRLPDVQEKWSLSSVELSVLLLMMVLLAGVGSLGIAATALLGGVTWLPDVDGRWVLAALALLVGLLLVVGSLRPQHH